MSDALLQERRVKISTTVDPQLLQAVDAFVAEHPALNRSRVFDEALRLWRTRQLEQALEAQYAGSVTEREQRDLEDWRRIRRVAAGRILTRDDQR